MVDKYGMGDTVYRDEAGKQTDKPKDKSRPKLTAEEQQALNTGRVQKEQQAAKQQEWATIRESTFARHADDVGLEDDRRNDIRAGDPMAVQAAKKKATRADGKQRPVYKGPPPKPNRFGIRPGFRWDGVDRGNGFEDKILEKTFSSQIQKEKAHRWSTSDM